MQAGEQAFRVGNPQAAITQFDEALRQHPQQERVLFLRSKAKYQLKDYQGALLDAQQILAINPDKFTGDDYNALLTSGIVYNNLRQFDQARHYLNKAKLADSTDVHLYQNVGYSYLEEQNYAAALVEYRQAVRLDPTVKTGFYGLGRTYYMLKQYPEAIRAFDQAIKLDPAYPTAYENRAAAKYQTQDLAGCCADLQRCQELGLTHVAAFQQQVCPK
ncbi:MAG: tetratricopeptide repeat protein [Janthinobacterium lividum]